ncbi:MAG: MFS transporter [Gemmataceae bacterium]|nr:MFS transporter [Gemmataceae bacterium]
MSKPRALFLLSSASLGWAVSFGLLSALAPVWMKERGQSPSAIGLNTSLYYLGVAAAAPFVPWLMRRAGRACVVAGMLGDALTTALFPFVEGALAWHLLRFLGGVATACSLIPMETQVNHEAPSERRAQDFSVYAFFVALGIGLGGAAGMPLYEVSPRSAFVLGGAVTLAAVALAWAGMPATVQKERSLAPAGIAWWRHSLGFSTAWAQGFLEGAMAAFLLLWLRSRGHGGMLTVLLAGVVVAQLPLGWLADRWGRRRMLLACHALLLAGLLLAPLTPWMVPSGALLFLIGAACGALYPLGLALLGERLPKDALGEANAWYLAANCAGSLTGPLAIGLGAEALGLSALFSLGAVAVVLAASAALLPGEQPERTSQRLAA